MSEITSTRSSIGSLVASRRRRLAGIAPDPAARLPDGDALRLEARRTGELLIEGHAADPADPERRFVVELLLDGVPTALARADLLLSETVIGDGCHGFVFALDPAGLPFVSVAEIRLANGEERVGDPIALHESADFAPSPAPAGDLRWLGGLDIEGWVRREAGASPARIEARIDDVTVAVARADRWREVQRGGTCRAEPGFRLRLPAEWADGRLHAVEIRADGQPLPGGPLDVLAFADGLAAHLDERAETEGERPRAERFDRWFPAGVPFAEFAGWEARFPPPVPSLPAGLSIAVAVAGEEGADASLAAPALDAVADWIGVVLPERDGGFEPSDLAGFLNDEGKTCDLVLFMRAGTLARPGGTERLAAALLAEPEARIAFGDVLLCLDDGGTAPLALTAFDYERALEQGAAGAVFAMRREAVLAALADGAGDLDRLFLHSVDRGFLGAGPHLHVPGFGFAVPAPHTASSERLAAAVVSHLAARGSAATVEPRTPATLPALRLRREPAGPAAILLDAGGMSETEVEACIEALEPTRRRRPVSLHVSSWRLDEAAARRLRLGGLEIGVAPSEESNARRLNEAASRVEAEILCLLDARLRFPNAAWLDELLGRLADPGVGLVAPVIAGCGGEVREAGLSLRLGQPPLPRFRGCGPEDPGHGDLLCVAHEVACVGSAALATRRADFLALGGFDPVLFPRHLGAADYALKLRALGRRVVVAPDARLLRQEAEAPLSPLLAAGFARETAALSARWARVMAADPFANPLLQRGPDPFGGLAWPPADPAPRTPLVAPPRAVAPGW